MGYYLPLFCTIFLWGTVESIAQTVSLTVVNGYGSGNYSIGDTVHIWSAEIPDDSVFAGWETLSTSIVIIRPKEWHTTVIMPQSSAVVRAKFRYSKPLQFDETTFHIMGTERNVWFAFPENLHGLITLHHFTNGTGKLWTSRTEYRQFCHAAFDAGYGLLAYNADEVERGDQDADGLKQWKALPIDVQQNPDHQITRLLLDTLMRRGIISSTTPLYAIGMSVGGGYAIDVGYALQFQAWANFCSGGSPVICQYTTVPGLLCPAEFDANRDEDIGGNTIKAFENYKILQERGVPSEYMPNIRHPLYPERFARVKGISKQESRKLFSELEMRGCVDAKKRPIFNADSIELAIRYTNLFPEFSRLNEYIWKEVLYQYRVAFADHEFHADFTAAILDFFGQFQHPNNVATHLYAIQGIRLFPHPASHTLHIQLPEEKIILRLRCTDMLGINIPIPEIITRNTQATVAVQDLPAGMYYLHIETTSGIESQLFIKTE